MPRGERGGERNPEGGDPGAFSPQPSSPSAHRSLCRRGKAGGGGSCFQLIHKCIDKELSESSACTEGSFLAFFAPIFVPPRADGEDAGPLPSPQPPPSPIHLSPLRSSTQGGGHKQGLGKPCWHGVNMNFQVDGGASGREEEEEKKKRMEREGGGNRRKAEGAGRKGGKRWRRGRRIWGIGTPRSSSGGRGGGRRQPPPGV